MLSPDPLSETLEQKATRWLRDSRLAPQFWLSRPCIAAAWLGLALAIVTPPQGTGFSVCWFKNCTGLPCPGCGLTRSLSCALRGMFVESWHYHPMGWLILGFLVLIAFSSLLPPLFRQRLVSFMEARAFAFNTLYVAFVLTFLAFGIVRALVQLGHLVAGSLV